MTQPVGTTPRRGRRFAPPLFGHPHVVSEARTPEEDTIDMSDEPVTDDEYEGPDPEDDPKGDGADEDQGT